VIIVSHATTGANRFGTDRSRCTGIDCEPTWSARDGQWERETTITCWISFDNAEIRSKVCSSPVKSGGSAVMSDRTMMSSRVCN
jgi:hypothetical protein